jgi:hypothetical protein
MADSYANVGDGRKTVTIAGTAERLVATNTPCRKVEVQALPGNTSQVAVGTSTVIATVGSERGTVLQPGATATLYVQDLYTLYLDAAVAGEGVAFTYYW